MAAVLALSDLGPIESATMVRRHGSATSTARCREAAHANKRDPAPAPGPRRRRAGAGPRCPRPRAPVHAAVALACQRACTRRQARSPRKESLSGAATFTRSSPTFAASLADGLNRAAEKRPRQHCQACDRRFLFSTAVRDPEGHAGGPMMLPLWSSKVSLRKWIRRIGSAPVARMNQHIILVVHQGRPMLRQYCSMASPSTNLLNPRSALGVPG